MKIRERYYNDAMFKMLVDTFISHIEQCDFTPTEIREATMLAQIIYEEHHIRPVLFRKLDVEKSIV